MEGFKSDMIKKFEEFEARTDKKLDELKKDMDIRFTQTDKRLDDLRSDMNARFDELIRILSSKKESRS